jgi:DNA repair exonuclease SbcCD ATPase subunit
MSEDTSSEAVETFTDLQSLLAWLWSRQEKAKSVCTEVEQVQRAFTTRLVDMQQRLDDAEVCFVAGIGSSGAGPEQWVSARLEERLPETRTAKTQRLEEVRARLQQLEAERTEIEQKSAVEIEGLAKENPALNAREEELKAERAKQEAELKRIDDDLAVVGAGLGWLLRPRAIHRLRTLRGQWETARYGTLSRLNEVRQAWNTHHSEVQNQEATYQRDWRAKTAEIAHLTGEQQGLERDFEGACRQEVVRDIARKVEEFAPTGSEQADEALQTVLALRAAIGDLQTGIGSVAEVLGLSKGICEGLTRFGSSVESVRKEQDMHSELAHLQLEAPAAALEYHRVWDEVLPIVLDENAASEHPTEFGKRLREVMGKRMEEAEIAGMFESLGACLNEATKSQWG